MLALILVAAVFDVVVSIVAAVVAENKGRSRIGWYFACMLLTPPVILILLALPSLKSPEPQLVRILEAHDETSKVCPQCAESVKSAAKICRFCRYRFPVQAEGERISSIGDVLLSDQPAVTSGTVEVEGEGTSSVVNVLPYEQPPIRPGIIEMEGEGTSSVADVLPYEQPSIRPGIIEVEGEGTSSVADVLPYEQPPVPPGFVEVERKQTLSEGQHVFHRIRGEGCIAGPGRNRYFVRVRYGALDRDVEEVTLGLFIKR